MKLNTLDRLQVTCPSLTTNFIRPTWITPGGSVNISGQIVPEITQNVGLDLLSLDVNFNWKNDQGQNVISYYSSANITQQGNYASFTASMGNWLPQTNVVLILEVQLSFCLKTPEGNTVYSTWYYNPGFSWPDSLSGVSITLNNNNLYSVSFSGSYADNGTHYEFQLCAPNGQPVSQSLINSIPLNPGLAKDGVFTKPSPSDNYILKARVYNFVESTNWAECFVPAVPAVNSGTIVASIQELPTKPIHNLNVDYSANVPESCFVTNVNITLFRNGQLQESHDGFSSPSGSHLFTGLPDTPGGWDYTIRVTFNYTVDGIQQSPYVFMSSVCGGIEYGGA
ncbi:MAG: hypothetical protein AB1432_05490 [Bacteroidota bacterium]